MNSQIVEDNPHDRDISTSYQRKDQFLKSTCTLRMYRVLDRPLWLERSPHQLVDHGTGFNTLLTSSLATSTEMRVSLAFSVTTSVEPEIPVIDQGIGATDE